MSAISRPISSQLLRISTIALAAALGAPIAHAQTVVNNQSVTVPPFVIPLNDDLIIGTTGTGSVTVENATVFVNEVILGQSTTGNGTLTLDGGLAALSVAGEMAIGNNGTGVFNILSGGSAQTSFAAELGAQAGSSGTVLLSGAGSEWNSSASIYVGGQGTGSMTVSDGATLTASNLIVGSSEGSVGTFLLTGSDSEVNLSSDLYVGDDGNGTFNLTDGATLTVTGGIYVGYSEGQGVFNVSGGSTVTSGTANFGYYSDAGKGTANISGVGTTWTINGSLTLGDEGGAGEMNITDGAQVAVTGALAMGVYDENITRGDLLISGTGSQLTVAGNANIGDSRPAIVIVSNGGYLQTGDTVIAGDTSASSSVTVTGAGSVWDSGDVVIGEYGVGQLIITDGGVVNGSGDAQVGYYGSGSSVTVSGSGSQWNLAGNTLDVGYYTDASVTVTDNAVLTAGDITIGYGTDGHGVVNVTDSGKIYSGDVTLGSYGYPMSGTMNISGSGSEWHVTGDITAVEDYGAATINVTDSGLLTVTDNLYLGSYGSHTDDIAQMTVSGTGTIVEIGGTSYIGYGAVASLVVTNNAQFTTDELRVGPFTEGTMTISNGAVVTATTATEVGGSGTLIFGAAAGEAATASGTLSTPTVTFTGGAIVFNHTNNLIFDAELVSDSTGYGDVQVLAGTTTFTTGTGAYSGTIEVTGGKAVFNADVGGDVTVSGSGIVGGSGTIGSLDALSGGTVSPGNSPGTLNVTGDVSFASGSTYVVEVDGAVSDLIAAGGTATLTGGTVQVSGSPSLMRYTILTSSALTGTFDGVETTSAFINYSLDYDLLNAYLVVDGVNSFTIAARTPNQYAVANALDKFPSDNPLYSAILASSISGAQQAFNALSGEIHASVGSALADDSRYVREAITGRLIQAYYGGIGAGGGQPIVMASAAPTDVVEMDSSSRMSLGAGYASSRAAAPSSGHDLAYWSRAFGAWGEYNTNGNAATTDRNLGGFITGVDGGLGGGWRAGLVTGYMYTGLSVDDRLSTANINSYVLGGYAGGALGGGFALRSGGTWTWNDIDSERSVVFPGFYEGESANYNGDVGQLFAELAYPVFTHGGVVEPFAGLAYVHVGTDGFTESGSVAALTSSGLDMNVGYGTLGARTGTTVVWGATTVIPHASLAWQYAFGDTTPEQALAFASTGIGMGIGGVPLAQNSALVEVGIDALVAQDATLGISYIGQYSGDFTDTGLRGRFNWKF